MKLGSLALSHGAARQWVPVFVLLAALTITGTASHFASLGAMARDRLRFEHAVERTRALIDSRMETCVALLRAGGSLFAAAGEVDRDRFHAFVSRLNLQARYPGIQGIGFSARVRPEERTALTARMRREGVPTFRIWPSRPRGEQHSILYLEPLDRRNRAAIGYDMFSEPVRRQAMGRARDTGAASASGKVTLVQEIDPEKQAGFLIYVPVYRGGGVPPTVAERKRRLVGFVYSPIRADDLLASIIGAEHHLPVDFRVYDGGRLDPGTLLHDSKRVRGALREQYVPRFRSTSSLDVAGRTWALSFATRPDFEAESTKMLPQVLFLGGLLVSLILYGVTKAQVQARDAAETLARQLRRSEAVAREEARTAEALQRITGSLAAELDARQLVQRLTDESTVLTGAEFGSCIYHVTGPDGASQMLYALAGASSEDIAQFPTPRSTEVFARTFRGEAAVCSNDITRDPRYGQNPPYCGMPDGHLPLRSYLAVPVLSRSGEVLGGLFFGHSRAGVFTERHERILGGLAAQAAVALDNARLFTAAQEELARRRRTEEQLAEVNRLVTAVFEASPLAIMILDLEGRVRLWNPAAEHLFGWTSEEAVGRIFPGVPADRLEELREGIRRTLAREGILGAEIRCWNRQGEVLDLRLWSATLRGGDGEPAGVIGILQDIRREKQEAEERERARAQILRLNEQLQRAMTETHHRVKNNLQVIAAMIDMQVLDGKELLPAEEVRQLGSHVRTLAMVHDLLTTQARENGQADAISARAVLARLVELLQETASGRTLRAALDDLVLPVRQGTSLALVANEAISNALKHGRGRVDVGLRVGDDVAELEVADEGPGFPDGFRLEPTRTTGLSLVESLSRWDLGGEAEFLNREGGGARVVVRMPVRDARRG